jgi:hypothetical protein
MLELTKRERKLAEVSLRRYRGLLRKKAPFFEWVGVFLILMGFLLRLFSWQEVYQHSLLTVGTVVLFSASYAWLIGLIGKLYEEILKREGCSDTKALSQNKKREHKGSGLNNQQGITLGAD